MSAMTAFLQNCYVTLAWTPADINAAARTGIRVAVRDYQHAVFVCSLTDCANATTITFNRHTAVTAGTSEVLDVLETTTAARSTCWTKEGTSDANILTADAWTQVVATTSSTLASTAGSGGLYVVEFSGDRIATVGTTTAGMGWVSADTTAPGASCIATGLWILTHARYAQNNLSVTLP